jgi:hypothetical protein
MKHLRAVALFAAVVAHNTAVAAAASPKNPTTDEVVALSPFTVSDTDDKS